MTQINKTMTEAHFGVLRLGKLCVYISAPRRMYLDDLAAIYAASLHDSENVPPAELHLEIIEAPGEPSVEVPPDSLVISPNGDLHTEAMSALRTSCEGAPRVQLTVMDLGLRWDRRHMYLAVLLNKIFFRMGYIRLHASAISLNGNSNVFIGDRGAGKSTICAYLAGRGGLVLADDDVMMHYVGNSCMVSGCDERMRIMPDTEAHLFGWLDVEPQEFGGHLKKQVATADQFATDPYTDHGLKRVFFPRVGEKFAFKRLPASQLVMRLMNSLVSANRFADALDHVRTLKTLSEVASQVSTYDLTLSPDFHGLDRLYEFLASDD